MSRHSRRQQCLRNSGNKTSASRVAIMGKRSYRQVGLRWPSVLACSVTAVVQVATSLPAHAQSIWTGTTSNNWFDVGNWQGGAVPTAADNVFLDTIVPNPTVVNAPGALSSALIVGNTGTGQLTISGGGQVT